eukprot:CAMPEP_0206145192 /NCGR_PEP_ID=MMETSP1473-20131121/26613_1 /ASSEMBLY_ACC=CAM_ASM_001109 /TAXON_ID=1461547 /ORGANISM="Stichococcus sp, Strain RCC1054" /LENGTH=188 /DNA_ID=CAMNT_0053541299 /DNA_START=269 /DNA_END=833 /DNA_ORIENTATION=+
MAAEVMMTVITTAATNPVPVITTTDRPASTTTTATEAVILLLQILADSVVYYLGARYPGRRVDDTGDPVRRTLLGAAPSYTLLEGCKGVRVYHKEKELARQNNLDAPSGNWFTAGFLVGAAAFATYDPGATSVAAEVAAKVAAAAVEAAAAAAAAAVAEPNSDDAKGDDRFCLRTKKACETPGPETTW